MKSGLALVAVLVAGCSLPRDPDGTLDRVRSERVFNVGVVASGAAPVDRGPAGAFLQRVATATDAQPHFRKGAAEPLLLDLEEGKLDLVIGFVSPKSPWSSEVAILQPLAETHGPQHLLLTPIARNGENAWIMLLEREARSVRAGATE